MAWAKTWILLMGLLIATSSLGSLAHAAADDDDADIGAAKVADKARSRMYPGGRDEQDLEVQSSLPQPSRSPEGGGAVAAESGAEPPAHD